MAEPVNLSTPLAYALAYAAMGWHVLPLEPGAKAPLGRLVPRGMHDATTDAEMIRGWWQRNPQAGVGIALAQSGLVAVDVDPRNGGTDTFEQLQAAHGSLRSDVMAFTGGGGEHHVFLVPHGAAISLPGTLGAGIDLKANGYIVVEPSVHPSGKQYGWEASSSPLDGVVPSPLPDWLRSLRVELQQPTVRVGEVPVDPVRARDAREALYLLDADEHDQWVKAGMALHSTRWGHPAYAMWCAWAQQSSKFDSTDQRKRWESFHTDDQRNVPGITLAWVFAEAQRAGWANPAAKAGAAAVAPVPGKYKLRRAVVDFASLKAVKWVLGGFIAAGEVVVWAGQPGVGKSTVFAALALVVAGYGPEIGSDIENDRPRRVLIVSEHPEQYAGIFYAFCKRYSIDAKALADVVVLFNAARLTAAEIGHEVMHLIDQGGGDDPPLVILDTASASFDVADENSNAEIGGMLAALKRPITETGAPLWVISHAAKALGREDSEITPRGASAYIGDVHGTGSVFRDKSFPSSTFLKSLKNRAVREYNEIEVRTEVMWHQVEDERGVIQRVGIRIGVPVRSGDQDRQQAASEAAQESREAERARRHAAIDARILEELAQALGERCLVNKQEIRAAIKDRGGFKLSDVVERLDHLIATQQIAEFQVEREARPNPNFRHGLSFPSMSAEVLNLRAKAERQAAESDVPKSVVPLKEKQHGNDSGGSDAPHPVYAVLSSAGTTGNDRERQGTTGNDRERQGTTGNDGNVTQTMNREQKHEDHQSSQRGAGQDRQRLAPVIRLVGAALRAGRNHLPPVPRPAHLEPVQAVAVGMLTNLAFVVPGIPQGKGRARVGKIGGKARMFTPAKTVAYEAAVAHAAAQAMGGHALLEGACLVEMDITCPVPASWSRRKQAAALAGEVYPATKPDKDNIIKAIYDGMNGVVWRDDVQAVDGVQRKRYGAVPGVWVRVAVLGGGQ